jgi:aryl-alcohol dehydrogenase
MEITAAVARAQSKPFEIAQLELAEPRADEVLVKVVGTGLCHTDLICRDQWYPVPLPAVLGHEGAGVVEAVGNAVTKVQPGDHVVLSFVSCGECGACKEGAPAYCGTLYDLNFSGSRPDKTNALSEGGSPVHGHFFGQSSFANYALAYERNVVKVDRTAPLELLGPLGCGIQTGAGAVLNSLHPHAGSSIVVFGVGSVGLAAVMAAHVAGCTTIVAVDLKPSRLEAAKRVGATHVIDPASTARGSGGVPQENSVVEAIQDITRGGAHYSLETTASPKVFRQAVDCLAQRGVCGLIGAAALGTEASFDMNTILFGRTIRGIIEGDSVPDLFIPKLVDLIVQDRFPLAEIVAHYPLAAINTAADHSLDGTAIKPVLLMS